MGLPGGEYCPERSGGYSKHKGSGHAQIVLRKVPRSCPWVSMARERLQCVFPILTLPCIKNASGLVTGSY